MNHSTPGLPVHHRLPEFTQTRVHRVGDAIQPSHPLSSPSPPAPNPSQHQSLFQWVSSSREVAKVLEFQLNIIPSKEHPGLISFRMDWLVRSVQFSSVIQSCPTLCNPIECSIPGLPVLHHFLKFAQIHIHWVSDAIQPFPPLSHPSPQVNWSFKRNK